MKKTLLFTTLAAAVTLTSYNGIAQAEEHTVTPDYDIDINAIEFSVSNVTTCKQIRKYSGIDTKDYRTLDCSNPNDNTRILIGGKGKDVIFSAHNPTHTGKTLDVLWVRTYSTEDQIAEHQVPLEQDDISNLNMIKGTYKRYSIGALPHIRDAIAELIRKTPQALKYLGGFPTVLDKEKNSYTTVPQSKIGYSLYLDDDYSHGGFAYKKHTTPTDRQSEEAFHIINFHDKTYCETKGASDDFNDTAPEAHKITDIKTCQNIDDMSLSEVTDLFNTFNAKGLTDKGIPVNILASEAPDGTRHYQYLKGATR